MDEKREISPIPRFELSGGALCLDFANTWEDRSRQETDKLGGYPALVAFVMQAGCLDRGDASDLIEAGAMIGAARSEAVWKEALELREAVYRIFSATAGRREFAAAELDRLNAALAIARAGQQLQQDEGQFRWTRASTELASPLWPIALSAAELLTSDDLERIRECNANSCNWLFLDRSRNRSRRWCSMDSCGNRAKARRHYKRCKNQ